MAGGGGNKKRFQYCTDPSGQEILFFRALQGHGRNPIDLTLQDNVLIPNNFFEYMYHNGCAVNLHSITNSGLIAGGQNSSRDRQLSRQSRCCFCFDQWRDRGTQWTGKIRQCGYPFGLWRCGQNPLVTRIAPERVQSRAQGALPWCLTLADGPGVRSPSSLLPEDGWTRNLGRRVRNLGGRQMHRVFQPRYHLHELVFACSPLPPRSSHTILTQADWCSIRAVARGELDLLPVIQTVATGCRVFSHKHAIRTRSSETNMCA